MLATPFLIGLAGSFHCIGMCNPLVMAASGAGKRAVYRNITYNIGRIVTYALLGSVISFFGMGLNFAGMQHTISIIAGITILLIGFANIRVALPGVVNQRLFRLVGSIRKNSHLSPLLMGMVNGLIPCGMTLVALGYCITLSGPAEGFTAMLLFGLGTMPAMFGISSILKKVVSKLHLSYHNIQTTLLIISGIILIGRGIADFDKKHADHSVGDDGIVVCGANGDKVK